MDEKDEKQAFAQRLNELCDDMKIPPKGHNRQAEVGRIFKVGQKGARKWLEGEGFPSQTRQIAMAKWGNVNIQWLKTGLGPKRGKPDKLRPDVRRLATAAMHHPPENVDLAQRFLATLAERTRSDSEPNHPPVPKPKTRRRAGG